MNYKLDFVKNWKSYFLVSAVILALGVVSLLIFGLHLGVDFEGGTRLDVYTIDQVPPQEMQDLVEKQGLSPQSVVQSGNQGEYVVMRFMDDISNEQMDSLRSMLKQTYGEKADLQESSVDPLIARELAQKAVIGVLMASIGIIIYVALRFEYRFGISAIIALLHDALMVVAFFSFFQLEVDLTFIAAVLTVVGYSVNDTIVIFDRIRWSLRYSKVKSEEDLHRVVNQSIWETLPRSINTMLTVLFVTVGLFIFGAETIRNFSLALLIGLISGGYSSIFIASQVWLLWRVRDLKKGKELQGGTQAS